MSAKSIFEMKLLRAIAAKRVIFKKVEEGKCN
jgi:hypothetical protein